MVFCPSFSRLTARKIKYNNFEISLVVFTSNTTTNDAITNRTSKFFVGSSNKVFADSEHENLAHQTRGDGQITTIYK